MNWRLKSRVGLTGLILVVLVIVPVALQGEILILKDGSELKGKIVAVTGDTLVFEPSFGGRISIHKDKVARIVYDESERGSGPTPAVQAAGEGVLRVTFEQNKLSSKIAITNKLKSQKEEILRANWIEQLLIVGTDTVFSRVDTTMDKTVYKGHERLYKNNVELEDIEVPVKAGVHRCALIIRNRGVETHTDLFDEGPLDLMLVVDTINFTAGQSTPLKVGIKKGFLKLGSPRLVVED